MERELLIPREDIKKKVKNLARQISSDYEGKELILVGILKGAVFFLSDLARRISIPIKLDFVRVSSYGSQMHSGGSVRLTKDLELPVAGKSIILVEDIVDTGLTLEYLIKAIEGKGADSIKICALIDKLERRDKAISIDYKGFQVEEGFIVGYGLDCDEKYRHLPDIYVLK